MKKRSGSSIRDPLERVVYLPIPWEVPLPRGKQVNYLWVFPLAHQGARLSGRETRRYKLRALF
jgi:hypothetical protein